MTLHSVPIEDAGRLTGEARDQQARWDAWRAKGARADARTQRQATWLAVALLGVCLLWVTIEVMRTTTLAHEWGGYIESRLPAVVRRCLNAPSVELACLRR